METAQVAVNYTQSKTFNDPDADIGLKCKILDCGEAFDSYVIYAVHRDVLARTSSYFFHLFEDGFEATEEARLSNMRVIPLLSLDENPAIVMMLLGAAYNQPHHYVHVNHKTRWETDMALWRAANKYDVTSLKAVAQAGILVHIATGHLRGHDAAEVYAEAYKAGDKVLAAATIEEAVSSSDDHAALPQLVVAKLNLERARRALQEHASADAEAGVAGRRTRRNRQRHHPY